LNYPPIHLGFQCRTLAVMSPGGCCRDRAPHYLGHRRGAAKAIGAPAMLNAALHADPGRCVFQAQAYRQIWAIRMRSFAAGGAPATRRDADAAWLIHTRVDALDGEPGRGHDRRRGPRRRRAGRVTAGRTGIAASAGGRVDAIGHSRLRGVDRPLRGLPARWR